MTVQDEQYAEHQYQRVQAWGEEQAYLENEGAKAQADDEAKAEQELEAVAQAEAIEKVADSLAYHVGTPLDTYGTSKKPQPDWCNPENCKIYREECETCIAAQIYKIYKSLGYVQLDPDQSLPESPYHYYSKQARTPSEETDSYCDIGYGRGQQDMLEQNWKKVKV